MALKFGKSRVELTGEVVVDDAETLFGWLTTNTKAQVDASKATHIHAAVLQALVAGKGQISKMPQDPFLADCIRQINMPV
ncbi:hypothetical protein [Rhizobium sp. RU36D]|uniref:hypothetical protein n=1 Tax=Rhizobium sp. RU36D TaxID=1907415 RepID=UPI0009D7CE37|nr:hypothetical protein [Rhizobium sp. RU36D]SMC72714.1 hypothetical protein SAMN05880593_105171 [Rhizobium sp. RU36D]